MENIIANIVGFMIVASVWLTLALLAGGVVAVVYSHLQDMMNTAVTKFLKTR